MPNPRLFLLLLPLLKKCNFSDDVLTFRAYFPSFREKLERACFQPLIPSVEFLLFFPRGVFLPLFPHILRCFKEEDFFREENFPSLGFKLRVWRLFSSILLSWGFDVWFWMDCLATHLLKEQRAFLFNENGGTYPPTYHMSLEQNQFTLRMVMMYEGQENGDTHKFLPKNGKLFSSLFLRFLPHMTSPHTFFFFFWCEQKGKVKKKRAYGEMARAPKRSRIKSGERRGWKINEDWTPQKHAHPLLAPNPTPIQPSPFPPFLKFEPGRETPTPTLVLFHASTRSLFAYWQLHKAQRVLSSPFVPRWTTRGLFLRQARREKEPFFLPIS